MHGLDRGETQSWFSFIENLPKGFDQLATGNRWPKRWSG
jgi:hypothetical protein